MSKVHVGEKKKGKQLAAAIASRAITPPQTTIAAVDTLAELRQKFLQYFVAVCAKADIPLEKLVSKHCREGGALPESVSSF